MMKELKGEVLQSNIKDTDNSAFMNFKSIYLVALFIILIGSCNNKNGVLSPVIKDEVIVFPGADTLFVKTVVWGISGNHHKTFISGYQKDDTQYNAEKDFIYQEGYPIYYRVNKDTLFMYVTTVSPTPDKFNSSIVVEQIKIDGRKFRELSEAFRNNELNKIDFP